MKKFNYCTKAAFCIALFFALNTLSAQSLHFFAMTTAGGTNDSGAIISFNPSDNSEQVVWNFAGAPADASFPQASGNESVKGNLVYDAGNHLFYAMTARGGPYGDGTIITFNPYTNQENLVWSFGNDTDGAVPFGDLVYDSGNGLFYGMTSTGGDKGLGAIISFNPSNNTENLVWSLGNDTDGTQPLGSLVYCPLNHLFYGMTTGGGSNFSGAIISFNPGTNSDNVVWSFQGQPSDGAGPKGDLVYNAGKSLFYGLTYLGGTYTNFSSFSPGTNGVIFSFNPSNNAETVLWNFENINGTDTDGENPIGNLVYHANDSLYYATTQNGGVNNAGAIISFNSADDSEKLVGNFKYAQQAIAPQDNLAYDTANGLFYGTAPLGGVNDTIAEGPGGSIFSFNLANDSISLVWSFAGGTDGFWPNGDLAPYYGPTGCSAVVGSDTVKGYVCASDTFYFNGNGYTAIGTYIDTLTTGSGCDSMITTIQLTLCNGINTISFANSISIYPNPANNILVMQSGLFAQDNVMPELYDVTGRLLELAFTRQADKITINTSQLVPGMYCIRLNVNGTEVTKKFVKVD